MTVATIGWDSFLDADSVQEIINGSPKASYVLHREDGKGPEIEDLMDMVRRLQYDLVVLDGDSFRELAECVEAFRALRKKQP